MRTVMQFHDIDGIVQMQNVSKETYDAYPILEFLHGKLTQNPTLWPEALMQYVVELFGNRNHEGLETAVQRVAAKAVQFQHWDDSAYWQSGLLDQIRNYKRHNFPVQGRSVEGTHQELRMIQELNRKWRKQLPGCPEYDPLRPYFVETPESGVLIDPDNACGLIVDATMLSPAPLQVVKDGANDLSAFGVDATYGTNLKDFRKIVMGFDNKFKCHVPFCMNFGDREREDDFKLCMHTVQRECLQFGFNFASIIEQWQMDHANSICNGIVGFLLELGMIPVQAGFPVDKCGVSIDVSDFDVDLGHMQSVHDIVPGKSAQLGECVQRVNRYMHKGNTTWIRGVPGKRAGVPTEDQPKVIQAFKACQLLATVAEYTQAIKLFVHTFAHFGDAMEAFQNTS
jgi:hypothetical protein